MADNIDLSSERPSRHDACVKLSCQAGTDGPRLSASRGGGWVGEERRESETSMEESEDVDRRLCWEIDRAH